MSDAHIHVGVRLRLGELDQSAALEGEELGEPPEPGRARGRVIEGEELGEPPELGEPGGTVSIHIAEFT